MSFKKCQITMEFLIVIGFLILISFGFILAAGIQMKNFSDDQKIKVIDEFGDSLKKEIALASVVKEGYARTVVLPEKIDDTVNYTISTSSSTLIIHTDNYEYSAIIPKTEGNIIIGTNIISQTNGTVKITN